ncbi:cyclopropane-fatty-acyl-phospholipid synthase family protein [Streptomyces sp. NPDC002057]|uniref:cyclopropane-fatty-acyl-phospholipid synthase family protein n=1 Tax=Streptomyces sp. NPDC002057 TaxID=3154664 RepID=UPI0033331D19
MKPFSHDAMTTRTSPGPTPPRQRTRDHAPNGVATRVAEALRPFLPPGRSPVRLRCWDGSEAGPADAPVVVIRTPRALRRILWQPGELGLAEAYIAGEIDTDGDLGSALAHVWAGLAGRPAARPRPGDLAHAGRVALGLGALGPRPAPPGAPRARLQGRLHTTSRDRAAISHHYDLSNAFYSLLLDETMAYSSAYWRQPESAAYGLADAQRDKLDLICRKLGLEPGMRLLDIGCGWGSLAVHAAREHHVRVTAVTLSAEQADHVRARVVREGLDDLVEVELRHYRDIASGGYDAVTAIEMGEHVGDADYPDFAALLHRMLRPRGRALVQQMSRGSTAPGGGPFIETYIAPDMHMRPVGQTLTLLEAAGLEVRSTESLREHYVTTIAAWHRTLEDRWDDFVGLVGEPTARVWRLYLVGSGLAFAQHRMGVDQILAVRTDDRGTASMPATPASWYGSGVAGEETA